MTTTNKEAKDFHKMLDKLKKDADKEEDYPVQELISFIEASERGIIR